MLRRKIYIPSHAFFRRRALSWLFGALCGSFVALRGPDVSRISSDGVLGPQLEFSDMEVQWNFGRTNETDFSGRVNSGDQPPFLSTEMKLKDRLVIVSSCDQASVYGVEIKQVPALDSHDVDEDLTGTEKMTEMHMLEYLANERFSEQYDFVFIAPCNSYVSLNRLLALLDSTKAGDAVHVGLPDNGACKAEAGLLLGSAVLKSAESLMEQCDGGAVGGVSACVSRFGGTPCRQRINGAPYRVLDAAGSPASESLRVFLAEDPPLLVLGVPSEARGLEFLGIDQETRLRRAKEILVAEQEKLRAFLSRSLRHLGSQLPKEVDTIVAAIRPPEMPEARKPKSRFDVLPWVFCDTNNIVHADGEEFNSRRILPDEKNDLKDVLRKLEPSVGNGTKVVGAYWRLDFFRGMELFVDVLDSNGRFRRFEALKPLGFAIPLQLPFVTEKKDVYVVISAHVHNIKAVGDLVDAWNATVVSKSSRVRLIVGVVGENATRQGFMLEKMKNCSGCSVVKVPDRKVLSLADVAIRRVPEDSILLLLDQPAEIRSEFLNRVRMQTIKGTQVYVPLPYVHFHPSVAKEGGKRHYSVHSGKFDKYRTGAISFYAGDYVEASENAAKAIAKPHYSMVDLFVRHSRVHAMVAPDRGLLIRFSPFEEKLLRRAGIHDYCATRFIEASARERCIGSRRSSLGSKQLLGKAVLKRGKSSSQKFVGKR